MRFWCATGAFCGRVIGGINVFLIMFWLLFLSSVCGAGCAGGVEMVQVRFFWGVMWCVLWADFWGIGCCRVRGGGAVGICCGGVGRDGCVGHRGVMDRGCAIKFSYGRAVVSVAVRFYRGGFAVNIL